MERRQGRRNVWITGAAASHETIGNIVAYNARLAERMLVALTGGEPSSDAVLARVADRFRFALDGK
jgi:hypothetical protein